MHAEARTVFDRTLVRVMLRAKRASEAGGNGDAVARQVASPLYHVTTAIAMAWEAGGIGSARRMRLAQLVLRQRVLPQDPLATDEAEPAWLHGLVDPAAGPADHADVAAVQLF